MELKEKLAQLKNKYSQEKQEAIMEDYIEKSMPISPKRVHLYDLYGRIASVKYGNDFRNEGIDKKTLIKLLKELPAESMYLVKDGCTSFRATKSKSERAENIEVSPIIIKVKNFSGTSLHFGWTYKLESGELIEIEAIITDHNLINQIATISSNRIEFRGGFRIENTHLHKKQAFENFQYIKWGTGSNQYANDFTLYSEKNVDLISIIENL